MAIGYPYGKPIQGLRTQVDSLNIGRDNDPALAGIDHHYLYKKRDPKTGKLEEDAPKVVNRLPYSQRS